MKIPQNGFWHCKVYLNDPKSSGASLQKDMSFDSLRVQIVKPYGMAKEFLVNGTRVHNRAHIKSIKIFHTDRQFDTYGRDEGRYGFSSENAYKHGTFFDVYLLYSQESGEEFMEIPAQPLAPTNSVTVSQANTQSVTVNMSMSFSNIEEIQALFDGLRSQLGSLDPTEEKRLKETQDALDMLSPQSSPEQANGALNKLKRVLKSMTDTASTLGKAIAGTAGAVENLTKIQAAYNAGATALGLPVL